MFYKYDKFHLPIIPKKIPKAAKTAQNPAIFLSKNHLDLENYDISLKVRLICTFDVFHSGFAYVGIQQETVTVYSQV